MEPNKPPRQVFSQTAGPHHIHRTVCPSTESLSRAQHVVNNKSKLLPQGMHACPKRGEVYTPLCPIACGRALAETGCPSLCQLLVPSKGPSQGLCACSVPEAMAHYPLLHPLAPLQPLGPSLSSEHRVLPDIGHSFICYSSLLPTRRPLRQKHGSSLLRPLAGCSPSAPSAGVSSGCTPQHGCWGVCSTRSCLWALIFLTASLRTTDI